MGRSKQCVILVGGLGTRLGALTRDLPKPMIDVAGRPFLEYLLHEVGRHGFRRVVLLAGYQAQRLIARFPQRCQISSDIELDLTHIVEPEPAGTAGALVHAAAVLDEEFLLLNGDSLFDFNLLDLLSQPVNGRWLAKLALRKIPDASRYGTVTLSQSRIVHFAERPERSGPGVINGGAYWLKREILQLIERTPCSLERDIFPILAQRGVCLGQPYSGFFIDIGVPEDLARAQSCLPDRMTRGAAFLDRDGVINLDDGYVHLPRQFKWIDGAREAIKWLNDRGFFVFVVTNQAGVGRGYYTEDHVRELHGWINEQLAECGAHIDAFRYCPFHPEFGIGDYRRDSDWRKPGPGMLQDLITCWPVRVEQSFLIGDKPSDMEAARRAGLVGHLFDGGDLRNFVEGVSAGRAPWPA
jgi:D-glycero-D-manno-heptose 1,7-bisphosphate phosphatase